MRQRQPHPPRRCMSRLRYGSSHIRNIFLPWYMIQSAFCSSRIPHKRSRYHNFQSVSVSILFLRKHFRPNKSLQQIFPIQLLSISFHWNRILSLFFQSHIPNKSLFPYFFPTILHDYVLMFIAKLNSKPITSKIFFFITKTDIRTVTNLIAYTQGKCFSFIKYYVSTFVPIAYT